MASSTGTKAAAVGGTEKAARKGRLYDMFAVGGKALANGKRLELLDLLAQGERTVEALAAAAELNMTTASAHLQTLKQAGFVSTRRDGVRIYYRLSGDDVATLFALLRKVTQAHNPGVSPALEAYLAPPSTTADAPVAEISREEFRHRLEAGSVVVLDVRPTPEFDAGHIPGAISIPVDQLAERVGELPAATEVVVYCRGEYCVLAYDAARMLVRRGRKAIRLHDGMLEWRLHDLPVASTSVSA